MPEPVFISVIVPTFNRAHFLPACLNSLLAEGIPNLEILVIDDGSKDGTLELLKSFPVKAISLPKNRGPGAARNAGLREAQGKYICFLDSDDAIAPGGLQWRGNWLEAHPEEPAVMGSMELILDDRGEVLAAFPGILRNFHSTPYLYRWKEMFETRLQLTSPMSGCMLRSETVKRIGFFDEVVRGPEDLDYFYRLLQQTDLRYFPVPTFRYRLHDTNLSIFYRNGNVTSPLRIEIERRLVEISHGLPGEWPDAQRWHLPDIVVPIFNAFDEVKACLESVLKHTPEFRRLILVDDCSTDPRIPELLEHLRKSDTRVVCLRTESNRGFVETANQGLRYSTTDVVLLNSDTLVGKNWLNRLCACLHSKKTVGIVTPVSNCGWIVSIPNIEVDNPLPEGWAFEAFAERVALISNREYPKLPTAVGFCMLISRKVIESVGFFDRAFVDGYGEEVDFSYRAREKGFEVACADDVFIYHAGSASYGRGRRREFLRERGNLLLERFWPGHLQEVSRFVKSNPYATLLNRLKTWPISGAPGLGAETPLS